MHIPFTDTVSKGLVKCKVKNKNRRQNEVDFYRLRYHQQLNRGFSQRFERFRLTVPIYSALRL